MLTDIELWERIKRNDEQAFSVLFHRYSSRIYSNAYYYLKDKEACEQIVHDIFITLWINREALEIKSFKAYLSAAARYRVYKCLTAAKSIPIDYKESLEDAKTAVTQNAGYNNLIHNELQEKIESGLFGLPKRCRQIFLLSRKQLLSNDEIAKKLGISRRSVENQLTRALKQLRLLLKDTSLLLLLILNCLFS